MKHLFTMSLTLGACLSLPSISVLAQTSNTTPPTPSPKKTVFGLPVTETKSSVASETPGKQPEPEPASPRLSIPQSPQGAAKGTIVVPPPPHQSVQPAFPIVASQDDSFHGSGGYMHTDIHILKTSDGSGDLSAVTHTWEVTQLRGFRGAVAVIFLDKNKTPLNATPWQHYGVDGVMIGTHDRTEPWSYTVPAKFMPQIRYIAIVQKWDPNNVLHDINAWLQGIKNIVEDLGGIIKAVGTIAG